MTYQSLLPNNATRFERAVEQSLHRVGDIDVDALKRMRDPALCSLEHLPFLAFGRGVDFWYEDWPEWKKRQITAEIYLMMGLKGTLPGISKYLGYVDAKVVESYIPPRGVVLRSPNVDALKAWRERFAELRLYSFQQRGRRPGAVLSSVGSPAAVVVGRTIVRANLSGRYYGKRAAIVDGGVETELGSIDQLAILGSDLAVSYATFALPTRYRVTDPRIGRSSIGRMAIRSQSRGRLIVINPAGALGGSAVPQGFNSVTPLNVAPERVYQQHSGKSREATVGRAVIGKMFVRVGRAERFIYDSWRLLDEERAAGATERSIGPVIGRMMPGLTPFTGLLRIDASYRRAGRAATIGRTTVGHFTLGGQSDRIDRVGAAIFRARSVRDQINFTTRIFRARTVADLSFDQPTPWGGMVPILNRSTP